MHGRKGTFLKLTIPKPITEIDLSHEEPVVKTSHYLEDQTLPNFSSYPPSNGTLYLGNGQYVDTDLRQSILEDCVVEGFQIGAIVVHKKIAMDKRIEPQCWGAIIGHNTINSKLMPWKPLRVRWLSGSYEDLHATDAIVMIHVPDKSILKRRALGEPNPPL